MEDLMTLYADKYRECSKKMKECEKKWIIGSKECEDRENTTELSLCKITQIQCTIDNCPKY